jgi:hypothetical protein
MKRFPIAVAATVMAFTATVGAQGPKAGTTGATKAHAPTTGATSAPKGGAQAPKGSSATGSTKSTTSGQSASNKTTGASKGQGKSANTTSTSTTTTSTSESTGTSTSTGTTAVADVAPPNPVSMKIEKNPAQLARAMDFLTPLGLSLEEGTAGFRNQGQFNAAMNASKNRGISFVDLQQAMTVDGLSLGQAAKKVLNTPPAPEAPATDTGTTGTGTTGTGTTGTGTTGTTGGTQ